MTGERNPVADERSRERVFEKAVDLGYFARKVRGLQEKFEKDAVPIQGTLSGLQLLSEGGSFDFRKDVWVHLTPAGEEEYNFVCEKWRRSSTIPALSSRKKIGEWTQFVLNEILFIFGGKLWCIELFKNHEIRFLPPN